MTQPNNKTAETAKVLAEHIAQHIPALIQAEADRIYAESASNVEAMTKRVGDELARRFADGVRIVSEKGVEDIANASAQAKKQAEELKQAITSLIDEARSATSAAQDEIRKAAEEKSEAQAMFDKARTERDEADKAIALMRLQGDIEIERMTKTAAFTAHEKATLQQLKNERAEMEDDFDRKADAITAGVQRYYPELSEQLEQIAEDYRRQEEEG